MKYCPKRNILYCTTPSTIPPKPLQDVNIVEDILRNQQGSAFLVNTVLIGMASYYSVPYPTTGKSLAGIIFPFLLLTGESCNGRSFPFSQMGPLTTLSATSKEFSERVPTALSPRYYPLLLERGGYLYLYSIRKPIKPLLLVLRSPHLEGM
ncbi:hypothetical protein CEXT_651761 [Caerostris extrusa]|uniref:Uncharacterized protein n=1 Tax=Caerostris extrusa TaxID=172846 RepID=A0AAV4X9C0_CAEEX|nr:hypothetical protein CEXT_651761 [Caerostris extrusa]